MDYLKNQPGLLPGFLFAVWLLLAVSPGLLEVIVEIIRVFLILGVIDYWLSALSGVIRVIIGVIRQFYNQIAGLGLKGVTV